MNAIQNTYINALLADACYVDLAIGMNTNEIISATKGRLTSTQAAYLAANFEIASIVNTSDISLVGSGFDATVWRGKAGTEFAGQVYVSMRGTQPGDGGADLLADVVDVAVSAGAISQFVDMVNWWLRETTPLNADAVQIKEIKPSDLNPAYSFQLIDSIKGTGNLVGVPSVQVNGHSLGGHLATAFARIFGGSVSVAGISTFNSAGFNTQQAEAVFTDLQSLLGTGLTGYASQQTNYYAQNGINFTTNDWWFAQKGARVGLYQEGSLIGALGANHAMYKLTDQLALGAALEKLDATFTIDKLNALVKAGSNDMKGSYEGVLDALLKALLAPNVQPLPTGDAGDSDANRVRFHESLAALQAQPAFTSLAGRLVIKATSDPTTFTDAWMSVPVAAGKLSETIAANQIQKSGEASFCFEPDATNEGWMRRAA